MLYISLIYFSAKYIFFFTSKKSFRKNLLGNLFWVGLYAYFFSEIAKLSVSAVTLLGEEFKITGLLLVGVWILYYLIDYFASMFAWKRFKSEAKKNSLIYSLQLSFVSASITSLIIGIVGLIIGIWRVYIEGGFNH